MIETIFYILGRILRQGVPCLFHLITGLYCPGCGGTRAARYLLHGQIMKSFWYHPLVLYMAVVGSVEFITFVPVSYTHLFSGFNIFCKCIRSKIK